jgi:hypothetical protein
MANNVNDNRVRELLGDRFLAMQSIARRLLVRKTAQDLRLFTALVEMLPAENRVELRKLLLGR